MKDHRLFSLLVALIPPPACISFNELKKKLELDESSLNDFIEKLQGLGLPLFRAENATLFLKDNIQVLSARSILTKYSELSSQELDVLPPFLTLPSTSQFIKKTKEGFFGKSRLCLAEHQTIGRGRQAKRWFSSIAGNILMSLHTRLAMSVKEAGGASLVVGISIIEALNTLGIDGLKLKWPNDIYWRDQKLAGILIESINLKSVSVELIIGIGLNVKMAIADAERIDQNWIDLSRIVETPPCRNTIIATIMSHLLLNFSNYECSRLESFMLRWQKLDYLLNKKIILSSVSGDVTAGIAVGINNEGKLLMRTEGNEVLAVLTGDISVRQA